ncbi:hypothetical protein FJW05_23260 [Mesorhizobium sp. B2-9-1]|uniref:hypothetical protein n=1 Tax=unclassified Mesorhizobium TaxID=325217 RepID=UPI0011264E91|nr:MULTISPECIES: hypothetical protein [unclassified Mesorhizobium]TPI43272.1 hypothetical protein FJW05_23260 [Mesorhizobium sp. B2-9-1]TPJ20926.1 hypothetical protein FJ425_25780 [Mesorhizobium sp. B2-7-2]
MTELKFSLDTLETGADEFLTDDHTAQLAANPHYDEIYIRWNKLFAKSDAGKLKAIRSVYSVQIWCDITRAAVNSIVQLPNLRALHLLGISRAGRLDGFRTAEALEEFSCLWGVGSSDLFQIAQLPAVRKLTAQRARITEESLAALLGNPSLTELDFEDSRFSDDFARMVSHSKAITALELGATDITAVGLQAICKMSQLRWLDIWSTGIAEHDLKMLSQLPNLEYLSIGGHEGQTTLTAAGTLATLYEIPSLKTVWLDGLHVTKQDWGKLTERFEKVWVSSVIDG